MSDGALLTADTTGDAQVAAPPVTQVLVRSTAAAVIYRLLNVAGGVVTLPLLLSALSRQEFGTWVVMSQSVSLFALSDLGAGAAIGRFVARYRGLGDRRGRSEVLSTVLALLTAAGLIVAALTWVLAYRVPGWVGVGPADRADAVTVFLIVGFGIAAQMPLRISLGVLVGHQLYGPHDIGRIAEAVLILAGIVGLFMTGNLTLMTLAIATVASAVIAQCILLAVAWHLTRPWDLSAERVTKPMAVGLLEMGGSALVLTASAMLYSQGTVLISGHLMGVVGAAVFGVALTVVGNLYPLITAMAIPLATLSSEWHARNDRERLRRTGLAVMRLTFATSACIAGGLVLFGEATLRWWLQKSDWTRRGVRAGGARARHHGRRARHRAAAHGIPIDAAGCGPPLDGQLRRSDGQHHLVRLRRGRDGRRLGCHGRRDRLERGLGSPGHRALPAADRPLLR